MNYYLDTEFLEGKQRTYQWGMKTDTWLTIFGLSICLIPFILYFTSETSLWVLSLIFTAGCFIGALSIPSTPETIDLISIGIVSEDGREYYAISKDFNLKEAWNRYQMKQVYGDARNRYPYGVKEYWIRENVLRPIFDEFIQKEYDLVEKMNRMGVPNSGEVKDKFTYRRFKKLLNKYGKTNKEIAEEIKTFVYSEGKISKHRKQNQYSLTSNPKFYAYFADYDWVVFCWLFGKMIDLPKGFPKFCLDIQQLIIENNINKSELLKYVPQINSHNAIQDAIWNKNAYNWIKGKINEER